MQHISGRDKKKSQRGYVSSCKIGSYIVFNYLWGNISVLIYQILCQHFPY